MNYINKGKRDILIFPQFSNISKIQSIREQYDELANLIPPHITLAFPFDRDFSNDILQEQLQLILNKYSKFKIKCKGVSYHFDERKNVYYIFLSIIEGKDVIQSIHNEIYEKILPDVDIKKYNYMPHITLGCIKNLEENIVLEDEFETIIDIISVEQIGDNEESNIIHEITLE